VKENFNISLKMKADKRPKVGAIKSFTGTKSEYKRAVFVLIMLETQCVSKASKESGLPKKALGRIINMFREKGHVLDSTRSGRPLSYTTAKMEEAYSILVKNEDGFLNGKQLQQKLVHEGVLHPTSDVAVFLKRLREYISSQGHRLITNSVKTTFFISLTDKAERLKYANDMLEQLKKERSLESLIFVDEVTYEQSPHPKGKTI